MAQERKTVVQHLTRKQLEEKIVEKASTDAGFRAALLEHPKKAIAAAFGIEGMETMKFQVEVLQETAEKLYLVLPPAPVSTGELSDQDLEAVAGGTGVVVTQQPIPVLVVLDPPPPVVIVAPPPAPQIIQTPLPQTQPTQNSQPTNYIEAVRDLNSVYQDQPNPAKSGK